MVGRPVSGARCGSAGRCGDLAAAMRGAMVVALHAVALELPLVRLVPPDPARWCCRYETPHGRCRSDGNRRSKHRSPTCGQTRPSRRMLTALVDLRTTADGHMVGGGACPYFATRALESPDGSHRLRRADQPASGVLPHPSTSVLACDIGVVVLLSTADGIVAQRARPISTGVRGTCRSPHRAARAGARLRLRGGVARRTAGRCPARACRRARVGGPDDPAAASLRISSLGTSSNAVESPSSMPWPPPS